MTLRAHQHTSISIVKYQSQLIQQISPRVEITINSKYLSLVDMTRNGTSGRPAPDLRINPGKQLIKKLPPVSAEGKSI